MHIGPMALTFQAYLNQWFRTAETGRSGNWTHSWWHINRITNMWILCPSKASPLAIFQGGRTSCGDCWRMDHWWCMGTCMCQINWWMALLHFVPGWRETAEYSLIPKKEKWCLSEDLGVWAVVERKFGKPPKYLRFDNGGELVNPEIEKWASEKGITIETTAPYSSLQNRITERFNRILLELMHAMLIGK